jgi:hypothetical protein
MVVGILAQQSIGPQPPNSSRFFARKTGASTQEHARNNTRELYVEIGSVKCKLPENSNPKSLICRAVVAEAEEMSAVFQGTDTTLARFPFCHSATAVPGIGLETHQTFMP